MEKKTSPPDQRIRASKYFKYAIGEIILVVVGILIALQINNWNSNRIQKVETLEICKRLLIENELNKLELESTIKQYENVLNTETSLLKMMGKDYKSKDQRTVDSLVSYALTHTSYNYKQSVLNQSLSGNQLSIASKELKNLVFSLSSYVNDIVGNEKNLGLYNNDYMIRTLQSQFSIRNMDVSFSPSMKGIGKSNLVKDPLVILSDFEFENILDNKLFLDQRLYNMYKDFLNVLNNLSTLLEKEIENLE